MSESMGDRLLLNGVWDFAPGPDGDPPVTGWQPLRVPHRSREFEPDAPSCGWYRTTLQIPEGWATDGLGLDLERVRHYGRVYLDGQALDEHHYLRCPWRVDLGDRVRSGQEYELVIFTHNCSGAYAHPDVVALSEDAAQAIDTRFWYTSAPTIGIEGDVWLSRRSAVRVEDVYVVTSVREKRIRVEARVVNEGQTSLTETLLWRVEREGRSELDLPFCDVEVGTGQTQRVVVEAPWPDPILWGRPPYGEPVLYFLRATLGDAESIVRFGFREVWTEGDQLLLNGEKLMPWGDHTLPYVYERQWLTRKFHDLAEANISIIEHHRYDPPQVLYDVADEMGVFVVGANFCVGTGQVPKGGQTEQEWELIMQHHLAVADAWIRRSRNHPSILFWDITDARDPAFCVPLLRKVKQLDPSRIAEVTFDPTQADDELIELIDCYRLFSSLEQIEASIAAIRAGLPVKPIRVGEAGIFAGTEWPKDEEPPLMDGWADFLERLPERNIHGLQTFHLADMDYHGFLRSIPNNLAAPLKIDVHWPSHSGTDARIDPFGQGTQAARGKVELYLNWCDPRVPVSEPTVTSRWSRDLFRRWTGRDMGPLNPARVPEVIVEVTRQGVPVPAAHVFVEAHDGQGLLPYGVQADGEGMSWFVLPEPGTYTFSCGAAAVAVGTLRQPVKRPPGYDHIQRVRLDLDSSG
jgi:beta-glucuronidase